MKKLFSVLALVGILATSAAHAQDAKAKTIMNKVSSKLKSAKAISANFTFTINDAHGKVRAHKSGTFQMSGSQYKISLTDGQQIICDGKSVWTYLPKNKEVQVSTFNPDEQTISPSKLFSGSLEKEYQYSYSGSKTIAGQKVEVISLTTKAKGKSFSKVDLYINTSYMIAGGVIYDNSSSSYGYKISNVRTNASISSSNFHFSPKEHPGVEVIDLR
jgi:chaperone LolA